MFIAKPFLNSDKAMKEFEDVDNAVAYLEKVTGFPSQVVEKPSA